MKTESLNLLQRLSKVSALWRSTYKILLECAWGKRGPVVSAGMTAAVSTLCRLPAAGLQAVRPAWPLSARHGAPLQVNDLGFASAGGLG